MTDKEVKLEHEVVTLRQILRAMSGALCGDGTIIDRAFPVVSSLSNMVEQVVKTKQPMATRLHTTASDSDGKDVTVYVWATASEDDPIARLGTVSKQRNEAIAVCRRIVECVTGDQCKVCHLASSDGDECLDKCWHDLLTTLVAKTQDIPL